MLINGRYQSMQFLINPWKWSRKSKQVENWAKKNAFPYFQDPVSLLMMHMLQASLQVMAAEKLILFFLFLQVEWQGNRN